MNSSRCLLLLVLAACAPASGSVSSSQNTLSHDTFAALSEDGQTQIQASSLPILLFPARYAPATQVMTGPHFYALNAHDGDVTVMLHVTDVVHHSLPAGESVPAARFEVRGTPARSGVNEGIRYVTWGAAGANYSLEVECHTQPLEHSDCRSPGFALDLAEELVPFAGAAQ